MYPKILQLRDDQPHKEKWQEYFDQMYREECIRLGLIPTKSTPEISMKQYNENTLFSLEPDKRL